jgi:peptidyl-dipeptidase Dcp
MVDGMPLDEQYLSFDQVKTIFHEFGHALNIALCDTKYQYHSCARASLDVVEIPSHYVELYLKDYSFVKKFALDNKKAPISK